uniref:7TM_GPCR_Srx domain-containing protein n=1 Tax=Heterorhabditis bacteriophora TaxID=37862 RepID=A0A1I7WG31_HETBA
MQVIGAAMCCIWYTMLMLITVLSFNRLLVVISSRIFETVFSVRNTNAIITSCYLLGSVFFVLRLLPGSNYYFMTGRLSWGVDDNDGQFSRDLQTFGYFYLIIIVVLSILSNSIIIISIISLVITSVYFILTFAYMCYIQPIYACDIINYIELLLWIFLDGINPIIYISINKRLRKKVVALYYKSRKRKNVTTISVTGTGIPQRA